MTVRPRKGGSGGARGSNLRSSYVDRLKELEPRAVMRTPDFRGRAARRRDGVERADAARALSRRPGRRTRDAARHRNRWVRKRGLDRVGRAGPYRDRAAGRRNAARDQGIGAIFIAHNPHHAYLVGDHFMALARGEGDLETPRSQLTHENLMFHMAGGKGLSALEHEIHGYRRRRRRTDRWTELRPERGCSSSVAGAPRSST
jgi:hypothetical protein